MRIAILGTRGIPAAYGGFETFAQELSVRLAAQGVDVTVFCEAGRGAQPSSFQGVQLRYVAAPRLGPLTTLLFDIRCLWSARSAYDVVYMLGYGAGLFCFVPRLWGSIVWINMDGVEWARAKWGGAARRWFKVMETMSVRIVDRVIADAEGIHNHLLARHPHMKPCSVIPYGASIVNEPPDNEPLRAWGLQPDGFHLVVCRLEPENRVLEIVRGFQRSEDRYPLIIVGDANVGGAYVATLKSLSSDRVRFVGTVYDGDRLRSLRFYARSYFHGHSVGGTNPSLLESLGCGNIVIAHDNVFNREVAGDLAWYFRTEEDVPPILESIEALPFPTRQERKQAAMERVRKLYHWNDIAERYARLLHETAAQRT